MRIPIEEVEVSHICIGKWRDVNPGLTQRIKLCNLSFYVYKIEITELSWNPIAMIKVHNVNCLS